MDKETNNSRDKDDMEKSSGKRNHYIGGNITEWNKRTRSMQRIRKERWTIMERGQNCLCKQKNLYAKQLKKSKKKYFKKTMNQWI